MGNSEHREAQSQSQPNLPVRVCKEVELKEHTQNRSSSKTDLVDNLFQKIKISDDEKGKKEMKRASKIAEIKFKKVKEVELNDKENEFDGELIETSMTVKMKEV